MSVYEFQEQQIADLRVQCDAFAAIIDGLEADCDDLRARLAEVEALCDDERNYGFTVSIDEVRAAARGDGDRLGGRAHGWFADRDPEDRNDMAWQPVLQLDGMCVSAEVWFSTEGECNAFIADNIIGQSWHPAAARGEGDRPAEPWPACRDHHEVQHRDGKPPWCKKCGWNRGRPPVPPRQVSDRPAECPHPDWSFDRTICGGCDSMPYACTECGWHECGDRLAAGVRYIAERDAELLRRLGEGPT